ncbi:Non-catalytic module family DOC2, partial [Piromyces sp. E2]
GIKCCSNQNTKVQYVDEIGNWGVENGELCGIGYERCSFSALDDPYPCCSSVNPEVVYTDESGNTWGYEDGQWCGI